MNSEMVMDPARAALSEDQAFDRGREALDAGRPEEGLSFVEPLLRAGSRNYGLWHLKGLLLRSAERHGEAIRSLEQAASLAPQSASIAHALARTLYEAGLPSVDAYARAVRLKPGDPDILLGLVAALMAERRIEEASAGLERSLSATPQWTAGHALLARLRWMQGEREGFTRSFDAALAIQPANFELRRDQIIALIHAEQWDEALRAIASGRAAIGDNSMFSANEAVVRSERGEAELADVIFDRLAGLADATIQVRRVRHFLRCNRAGEAGALIDAWLGTSDAYMFWPYASAAWRMTGDPRWDWLEGDPRFVGIYDIADRLPPLEQVAATLRRLHTTRGEPLDQSVRGGTQTDGNLFYNIDPVIVRIREAIRATVAEHVAQLPPPDPRHPLLAERRDSVRFAGAWSVRLAGGGYHANHMHLAGWISSALYIVLPPGLGEGDAGFLTLGEPQAQLRLDLPRFKVVEPKPGRLVLFPSYTWHGTRPFGEGERLTIAFDVARPM